MFGGRGKLRYTKPAGAPGRGCGVALGLGRTPGTWAKLSGDFGVIWGQKKAAGKPQVLVLSCIYQGSILGFPQTEGIVLGIPSSAVWPCESEDTFSVASAEVCWTPRLERLPSPACVFASSMVF